MDVESAIQLNSIIKADSQFLMEHNLMDYSLFITVENTVGFSRSVTNRNRIHSSNFAEIYHIGIIDYLQEWNGQKKMERCGKSLWTDPDTISAADPIFYANRFENFMRDQVFLAGKTEVQSMETFSVHLSKLPASEPSRPSFKPIGEN